jgi:hypothetical protein
MRNKYQNSVYILLVYLKTFSKTDHAQKAELYNIPINHITFYQ